MFSTPQFKESVDNAVDYIINQGVPPEKIAIGAAFYARVWKDVPPGNNGLGEPGIFRNTVGVAAVSSYYTPPNGYAYFWDDTAKAPFLYNASRKLFVTFDDIRSVKLKTEYMISRKLNGIMFWQIALDKKKESLLSAIYETIQRAKGTSGFPRDTQKQ